MFNISTLANNKKSSKMLLKTWTFLSISITPLRNIFEKHI